MNPGAVSTGVGILLSMGMACAQTPEEFAGVDTILNEARSTLNLSGFTFVVVRDGQMIYQRSFGNVQPDTPIQIASATKWMSAAVVMAAFMFIVV